MLTAAEVCGWAAIFAGQHVKKSEVHGMAQRGGSVESHLRFGGEVYSPLIPYGTADFLLSSHADEGARLAGFLKKGGIDLTPVLNSAAAVVDDKRYINTYLLGVLSQNVSIPEDCWLRAIDRVFARKNAAHNKEVFLLGRGPAV